MNRTIYQDEDKNAIRFSKFTRLELDCPFTGLGVKYVASGEEVYYANAKKYTVKTGEYLIGNNFTDSIVQINHKEPVQGLCIDIASEIISEVAEFYDVNSSDLKEFLLSDQLFVNRYRRTETRLGVLLHELNQQIQVGTFIDNFQQQELFYTLAETMIADQKFIFNHLSKMGFKKQVTNEEVFRAVLEARSIINESITDNLSLDTMAQKVGISKYHFIRVFKTAFGVTPYQYQRKKRLEHSKQDLMAGKGIFDTAIRYGFSDVQTFSKAFKRYHHQTPGSIKKSNF